MKVLSRLLCLVLCLPLLTMGQEKIIWNKDGKEMVLIPAGYFEMGDHLDGMSDALPVHRVELDAFYMDTHEVTVGQFKQFDNETGHSYNRWNDVAKYSPGDEYPMGRVNWNEATAYASWAGKRLPTEAEWEYAARGRLIGKRYVWGDVISRDNANYTGTSGKDQWKYCAPVGSLKPNGYGLYDMGGNVWEWCADWYDENHYSLSAAKNPLGPDTGQDRVLRGGSWNDYTFTLRVAHRSYHAPAVRYSLSGFRTVSGAETKPTAQLIGDVNGDRIVNILDLVIAAGSFGKTGAGIMGDVNGDGGVNIFDLVIVTGNFGHSLLAAPATAAKIELSTDQKRHIATAIDQLAAKANRSRAEEIALSVLKAILPDRLPSQTQLLANYPNPFNPETWIPFELADDAEVTVTIYDVQGKRIRQLQLGQVTAGRYVTADQAAYWNGKTETGEVVSSGTYFYQLQAGDYTETRKMVILK